MNALTSRLQTHRPHADGPPGRAWAVATIFARLALAVGFPSAVADRFGVRGGPGVAAALVPALAPGGAYACTADRLLGPDPVGRPGT